MTTFDQRLKKTTLEKPPRVIELPVSAWVAGREDRPSAPMPIGIRGRSQTDDEESTRDALEAARDMATDGDRDDYVAAYNNALMREVVARATCLAVDARKPFFGTPLEVGMRLTPEGVRRLWQEIEILAIANNPGLPEATDEGLSHLIAMWDRGIALEHMKPEDARVMRRLVEYVRQTLADVEAQVDPHGVMIAKAG